MKSIASVLPVFLLVVNSFGQSPFKEFRQVDVLILEGGVIVEGLYRYFKPAELSDVNKDPNRIPAFERGVIRNNSLQAHKLSNVFLYSSVGVAVGSQFAYDDLAKTGYLAMETFLVTDVLTLLSKTFVKRSRPFVYNGDIDSEKDGCETYDLDDPKIQASFFSGHTSSVTAYNFLSASLFSHYHPDSDFRVPVWVVAGAASSYVGYLRVRAGKHFPTDVVTGFLAGGAAGFFIPRWHRAESFSEDDSKYWRDLGFGIGAGLVSGVLYSVLDKDPAPRECEKGIASRLKVDVGPTGFSAVYSFQ